MRGHRLERGAAILCPRPPTWLRITMVAVIVNSQTDFIDSGERSPVSDTDSPPRGSVFETTTKFSPTAVPSPQPHDTAIFTATILPAAPVTVLVPTTEPRPTAMPSPQMPVAAISTTTSASTRTDIGIHTSTATTASAITSATTFSTSTTESYLPGCPSIEACRHHGTCGRCLDAITALGTNAFIVARGAQVVEDDIFETMVTNPNCQQSVIEPSLLYGAFLAFGDVYPSACPGETAISPAVCVNSELRCLLDSNCSVCIDRLFRLGMSRTQPIRGEKDRVLQSPECVAGEALLRDYLLSGCGAGGLPVCSYGKLLCSNLTVCAEAWTLLRSGQSVEASVLVASDTSALRVFDSLVDMCVGTDVQCEVFRTRCDSTPKCAACLDVIGTDGNLTRLVEGFASDACSGLTESIGLGHAVESVLFTCGGRCSGVAFSCMFDTYACRGPDGCIAKWLRGEPNNATCNTYLRETYFVSQSCDTSCPAEVAEINKIVLATSAIGWASLIMCCWVIVTAIAHGRTQRAMLSRIVVGLMGANAVYSSANAIPLGRLGTGYSSCGALEMSFETVRFGRAWWFGGKYALVAFEIFILAVSIFALLQGESKVRGRYEIIMHVSCVIVGAAAFAGFYIRVCELNDSGYNRGLRHELQNGPNFNPSNLDDDVDEDDHVIERMINAFTASRQAYDAVVQQMLQVWDGILGIAIVMWGGLRIAHSTVLKTWRGAVATAQQNEDNDEWKLTRKSAWLAKRRLLDAQCAAYREVARPLEPYVLVFVIFGVPAMLMSTDYCQDRSGVIIDKVEVTLEEHQPLKYGMCDVWCELALSLRSLAAVIVYLTPKARRIEFFHVRKTLAALVYRWRRWRSDGGVRRWMSLEMVAVANATATTTTVLPPPSAEWLISPCEISFERILDSGAFGAVWAGRWRASGVPVAVKVLFNIIVDEDGVLGDAMHDFARECSALQAVYHPNLLNFHGFGTTAKGEAFIVTELMPLGGLNKVLKDPQTYPLPLHQRVSIALQIANGMSYLHAMPILHRDLKSANVLLGEGFRAKVGDFGLSRCAVPHQIAVMHSPFTGQTEIVPMHVEIPRAPEDGRQASTDGDNKGSLSEQLARTTYALLGEDGKLTKAVGTMMWMAPEMFRGDTFYGKKVDVYSFGVVLWEIAARATPWDDVADDSMTYLEAVELVRKRLQSGHRPTPPEHVRAMSPSYVDIMERCWAGDPANRPSFAEVVPELAASLRALAVVDNANKHISAV